MQKEYEALCYVRVKMEDRYVWWFHTDGQLSSTTSLTTSPQKNRGRIYDEKKIHLIGWDKNREITYYLLSQTKQTQQIED